jgi:hypothetical protein
MLPGRHKMSALFEITEKQVNFARYESGQKAGHYESFFQRANHPTRPLAFWIRYTVFSPNHHPEDALGELWAIFFDGETGSHVAVKKEVPFHRCIFRSDVFFVQVADAFLEQGRLKGNVASHGHNISWELAYSGTEPPLFLLPLKLYTARFPKAKSLVGLPKAIYNGSLSIDGKKIEIENWVGSQNHNWGSRHTDLYAWGQVAGFDSRPDSFLEVASARLKIGPFWTPWMTPIVLRHQGIETKINSLIQTVRAKSSLNYFKWSFISETEEIRLEGEIAAPREVFIGLNYRNPPGGSKHCLNSKIAACQLKIQHKQSGQWGPSEILFTKHRAAFEILTDTRDHGVDIRV